MAEEGEITQQPKCYGFDTGFVTFVKGWSDIREEDRGLLWEHLVLDTLRTSVHIINLFYWRDKSMREIDFVIKREEGLIDIVECKINPEQLNIKSILVFRSIYPYGNNYIVSPNIKETYKRKYDDLTIIYYSLTKFLK